MDVTRSHSSVSSFFNGRCLTCVDKCLCIGVEPRGKQRRDHMVLDSDTYQENESYGEKKIIF